MKMMLHTHNTPPATSLRQSLANEGYQDIITVEHLSSLVAQLRQQMPALVIIQTETPNKEVLGILQAIDNALPTPVVVFAEYSDFKMTQAVTDAGVSAYIVGEFRDKRLKMVLDTALARFQTLLQLKSELSSYKKRLEDRQDVEKAKGVLMLRRNLSEAAAYQALRKLAMDQNMQMGDAARHFVAAMALLEVELGTPLA